jgi:hypothetical protein
LGLTPLPVPLPPALAARVAAARAASRAALAATSICVLRSARASRAALVRAGVAPDAMCQAALQVAHARLHGGAGGAPPLLLPPTYESAS